MNCAWLNRLTDYHCRETQCLDGATALEIGTPFAMAGGSPITLYLIDQGSTVLLSDNGDTLANLSATGIDPFRSLPALRRKTQRYGLTLTSQGAFETITRADAAAWALAQSISGLIQVADWGADAMRTRRPPVDLAQEALPYIVARDNRAIVERNRAVIGASNTTHVFDIRHGADLIDVIAPKAQATGAEMRKVGDVQNGPFAEGLRPLIIVDDRYDPIRAAQELAILASIARSMPFSGLMQVRH